MQKIAILLGSGAEGVGQYNLLSGAEFKIETIKSDSVVNIMKNINYSNKINDIDIFEKSTKATIIRHNNTNVLYQSYKELTYSKNNSLDDFLNSINKLKDCTKATFTPDTEKTIALQYNNLSASDIIKNYSDYRDGVALKQDNKVIIQLFSQLYKNVIYNNFKSFTKNNSDLNDETKQLFEKVINKLSFYSDIDSEFNYLRMPGIYQVECATVLKLYYSAYMALFKIKNADALKDDETFKLFNEKINKLRSNNIDNSTSIEYRKILLELYELFIKILIQNSNNQTYYKTIKSILDDNNASQIQLTCVTLNYTTILDEILNGSKNCKIYHLHGSMNMFEDLETKEIKPLKKFIKTSNVIFPYILIQSGVKPIIAKRQIKEFNNAVSAFEKADKIIVLGYGMCSDDEHITNLLKDSIITKTTKSVYYLVYATSDDVYEFEKINVLNLLHLSDYYSEGTNEFNIKNKTKLIFIKICNNSNDVLEKVLKQ